VNSNTLTPSSIHPASSAFQSISSNVRIHDEHSQTVSVASPTSSHRRANDPTSCRHSGIGRDFREISCPVVLPIWLPTTTEFGFEKLTSVLQASTWPFQFHWCKTFLGGGACQPGCSAIEKVISTLTWKMEIISHLSLNSEIAPSEDKKSAFVKCALNRPRSLYISKPRSQKSAMSMPCRFSEGAPSCTRWRRSWPIKQPMSTRSWPSASLFSSSG
jgi:hypothetical protein